VLVTEGDENPGHGLPRGRDGLGVIIFHVENSSYIDMYMSTNLRSHRHVCEPARMGNLLF
jgi:hypothetical protein